MGYPLTWLCGSRDALDADSCQVTTLLGGIEEREKEPIPTADEIASAEQNIDELRKELDAANEAAANSESSSTKKKAKGNAKKLQAQIDAASTGLAHFRAKARERGGLPRTEEGGEGKQAHRVCSGPDRATERLSETLLTFTSFFFLSPREWRPFGTGVDYGDDFFGKAAFLTVSGQLAAEASACALSSVYTFGPTFRAENSHTTRHIAEFWVGILSTIVAQ